MTASDGNGVARDVLPHAAHQHPRTRMSLVGVRWKHHQYGCRALTGAVVVIISTLHIVAAQGPTASPTTQPTNQPSLSPTVSPSRPPSVSPTVAPTLAPTVAPTFAPTVAPSNAPTATPTFAPTHAPTTIAPSAVPTIAPTALPSLAPTVTPSIAPTSAPSNAPSGAPSLAPSAAPSLAPSAAPSLVPSAAPSLAPTPVPSLSPTAAPSLAPTAAPTAVPSATPTTLPSASPTAGPSTAPTAVPTSVVSSAGSDESDSSDDSLLIVIVVLSVVAMLAFVVCVALVVWLQRSKDSLDLDIEREGSSHSTNPLFEYKNRAYSPQPDATLSTRGIGYTVIGDDAPTKGGIVYDEDATPAPTLPPRRKGLFWHSWHRKNLGSRTYERAGSHHAASTSPGESPYATPDDVADDGSSSSRRGSADNTGADAVATDSVTIHGADYDLATRKNSRTRKDTRFEQPPTQGTITKEGRKGTIWFRSPGSASSLHGDTDLPSSASKPSNDALSSWDRAIAVASEDGLRSRAVSEESLNNPAKPFSSMIIAGRPRPFTSAETSAAQANDDPTSTSVPISKSAVPAVGLTPPAVDPANTLEVDEGTEVDVEGYDELSQAKRPSLSNSTDGSDEEREAARKQGQKPKPAAVERIMLQDGPRPGSAPAPRRTQQPVKPPMQRAVSDEDVSRDGEPTWKPVPPAAFQSLPIKTANVPEAGFPDPLFHTISSGYHTLTSSVPSSTDVDYDENAAKKRLDDVDPYATPADFEGTIKSMMMRPPDVPTYNVKQQLPVIRGGVPMAGFAGMKKVASPLVRDAPSSASVRSNLDRAIFGEPDSDDFISSVAKGSSSTGPAGASRTDSKTSRAVKEVDGVMYEVLDELLSELGNEEMGSETPLEYASGRNWGESSVLKSATLNDRVA